ncbi:S8 family serine peptidase [Faecalicatena contorta]|uniref:S8 family serine peptidase n=1 Tax=Faecalicatena contorta TaxID=39482 RepID=UPI001F44D103|nr:S8 family serine peptidase [Faecalicatena contorta]MCF2683517.1 S8 family serine peptidase [Faecalicatena contorta]
MSSRRIKGVISALAVGCTGYLLVSGLMIAPSKEEALQAYRYEKDQEVTYVSRTDAEHIRENGIISYADNELIVQLAGDTSEEEASQLAKKNGAELSGFISPTDTCQWKLSDSCDLEELNMYADEITELTEVAYASVNYILEYQAQDMSTSESGKWKKKEYHWGYEDIHADQVWEYVDQMNSPINIGISDMGFQTHDDLDYTIVRQGDMSSQGIVEIVLDKMKEMLLTDRLEKLLTSQPMDKDAQHGTHVTGIAAAVCNNKKGIAGVYPDPTGQGEVLAYAQLYEDGTYISTIQDMDDVARMLLNDTKVINMSLGVGDEACYSAYKEHDSSVQKSHAEEYLKNCAEVWGDYLGRFIDDDYEFLLVNSSGNASNHSQGNGQGKLYEAIDAPEGKEQYQIVNKGGEGAVIDAEYSYPLLYLNNEKVKERIICVGAYGKDHLLTRFSNMSQRVDILAPGYDIYSTCNESLMSKSGTSMAAPYVTGAVACIWSLDDRLTASEVRKLLLQEMYDANPEMILDVDTNIKKPMLNLETSMSQAERYIEEHREELEDRTSNHGIPMTVIAKIKDIGVRPELKGHTREQMMEELEQYAQSVMIEDAVITITNEDGEVVYDHRELLQKSGKVSESSRDNNLINFFLSEGDYTVTVEAEGYEPVTVEHMNPQKAYPENHYPMVYEIIGMTMWEFELEPIVDTDLYADVQWWRKKEEDDTDQFTEYLEEELIPKYGVMATEEIIKMPGYMDAVWLEPEDLQGILAVKIDDYDSDKRTEMLLVRSSCEEMDREELMKTEDQGGGTRIFLEMYEYNSQTRRVECSDSVELVPCGKYRSMSDRVHTGIFTYSNDGTKYIGIDSYYYMEAGITTVSLYQYQNRAFEYVMGACRQRLGSGYESVSETDYEPEAGEITMGTTTWTGDGGAWKMAGDYDAAGKTEENAEVRENIQKLDAIYAELLKKYGLSANDIRLSWDNQEWDARTAGIYTSEEGDLSVMASMATCYVYRDMREYHLFREDPAGSLDAYR